MTVTDGELAILGAIALQTVAIVFSAGMAYSQLRRLAADVREFRVWRDDVVMPMLHQHEVAIALLKEA